MTGKRGKWIRSNDGTFPQPTIFMTMDTPHQQSPLPLLFQAFSTIKLPPNPIKYMPLATSTSTTMLLEDPSVHSESIELRSRNSKSHMTSNNSNNDVWHHEGSHIKAPLMDHFVKNGESLMQIALQYSVPVSEIKRANNIVADQEIHGLPVIRIPVTRAFLLRRQMMEAAAEGTREGQIIQLDGEEGTSGGSAGADGGAERTRTELGLVRKASGHRNAGADKQMEDAYSSQESLTGRAREVIEGILDETDRNMAAVRQNLPSSSPTLEGGAFHFVDAGVPDHSSNVWLIVAVVLFIFVLIPLALTFLEETGEMEQHHQSQQ